MNGRTLVNASNGNRRALDFYPTPEDVTITLCNFLEDYGLFNLSEIVCIEPACGNGKMSKVLERYFKSVYSSDIQSECYGIKNIDYLQEDYKNYTQNPVTALITNPPFFESENFIKKAISENHYIVAMLLKSQYWHSKKRYELFTETKPTYLCIAFNMETEFLYR